MNGCRLLPLIIEFGLYSVDDNDGKSGVRSGRYTKCSLYHMRRTVYTSAICHSVASGCCGCCE